MTETPFDGRSPENIISYCPRWVEKVAESHESATVETGSPTGLGVTGDELVGQVIDNVVLNTFEHNDTAQPWVRVTARAESETVVVRVADNGPGIPGRFRDDVASPGVTAEESGTIGFGLYFVKVMIEEYGGHVSVETNDLRGTVAVLTFERAESDGRNRRATRNRRSAQMTADQGSLMSQNSAW